MQPKPVQPNWPEGHWAHESITDVAVGVGLNQTSLLGLQSEGKGWTGSLMVKFDEG